MLYEGDPTPAMARHIIHRMGETGQPPERGALYVNVATNDTLEVLRQEYLVQIKDSGRNSSFKLVQAPFGGGKTQFLLSLREVAWQEDFATSRVDLSPRECPFDKPEKIYQAVASGLELAPTDLDEQPEPGIDVVLRTLARTRASENGQQAFIDWLRGEFEEAPVANRSYRKAVSAYMRAVLDHDFDRRDLLADYLRGTRVPASDLTELRIREQLSETNAFGFLKSLTQCLAELQVPGVVLLFDEMDRNLSLSPKRRIAIGDNLRQMIDQCGQATLPGVLWCYAVPPEFMTTIVPEYPALAQRLKSVSSVSTSNPLGPLIDLDRLGIGAVELMCILGRRLVSLYNIGFETALDGALQEKNIGLVAEEYGAMQFESGTRREFVKVAIQVLSDQHLAGERELTAADLRAFISPSGAGGLEPLEGEQEIF